MEECCFQQRPYLPILRQGPLPNRLSQTVKGCGRRRRVRPVGPGEISPAIHRWAGMIHPIGASPVGTTGPVTDVCFRVAKT